MSNSQYMQRLSEVTQAVVLDDADRRCNVDVIIDNDGNLNLRLLRGIPAGRRDYHPSFIYQRITSSIAKHVLLLSQSHHNTVIISIIIVLLIACATLKYIQHK